MMVEVWMIETGTQTHTRTPPFLVCFVDGLTRVLKNVILQWDWRGWGTGPFTDTFPSSSEAGQKIREETAGMVTGGESHLSS